MPTSRPQSNRKRHTAFRRRVDELRTGLWFVPTLCILGSVGAAITLVEVDRGLDASGMRWTFAGGPQNVDSTLTTIASSMITFTGLVFSITVVALQLTSSQFSPRALRTFLRDRTSQVALGVFVGTFAYAFVALAAIRYSTAARDAFVPSLTVTGAYLLVGGSVALFIRLIHHTADSLRAVTIIDNIARETIDAIAQQFPDDEECEFDPPRIAGHSETLAAPRAGVVTDVDLDELAALATDADGAVEVLHRVGSFVCKGEPLLRIFGSPAGRCDEDWAARVHLGKERSMRDDAGFGLRQLVDIAERALSPGTNDPTTAVQCIQRIHDILRTLATRRLPTARVVTVDDVTRAWLPLPSFHDFVALGSREILESADRSQRVRERMRAMFHDLLDCTTSPEHRAVLAAESRTLSAASL